MVSFKMALQKVLKRFAGASAPRTQAEIQRVYTGLGAEFGQPLTHNDIIFAVKREPVAHRIVFAVAHDIFDNWFEVEPLEEEVDKKGSTKPSKKYCSCLTPKMSSPKPPFSSGLLAGA
ncbi:MAG: hypothetical protein QMD23_05675 [Candidatus Bathyarchaeia archaeon]|nr:hypothetical protein [Candidatus Bathyarchaeia archaeon]